MAVLLRPVAPLVVLAALALSACGEDRLSRTEYAERGNAACSRFVKTQQSMREVDSIEQLPKFIDSIQAAFDRLTSDLKELSPPEDLQDEHDALMETAKDTRGKLDELRDAAEARDEQRIQKISQDAESTDRESDRLARRLGLTTCAEA